MRASQWLRLRARALFDRTVVERELEEELAHHLELDVRERVRRGAEPQAARR